MTCSGSVNAVSVAATDVQIKNDIIDSKGQTGISSAILASTSSGVQWASIGAILGANVTINSYNNSQRNGNGTEYTNTSDSISLSLQQSELTHGDTTLLQKLMELK